MPRSLVALALAFATVWPMDAITRPIRRSVCVPVSIEGAGFVRICAPAPAR